MTPEFHILRLYESWATGCRVNRVLKAWMVVSTCLMSFICMETNQWNLEDVETRIRRLKLSSNFFFFGSKILFGSLPFLWIIIWESSVCCVAIVCVVVQSVIHLLYLGGVPYVPCCRLLMHALILVQCSFSYELLTVAWCKDYGWSMLLFYLAL